MTETQRQKNPGFIDVNTSLFYHLIKSSTNTKAT